MSERKQINFTIVPDDTVKGDRTYANFCAVAHTPFDCTLTFCEVLPLSEDEIRTAEAGSEHTCARRCGRESSFRSRHCRRSSRRSRNKCVACRRCPAQPGPVH